MGGVVRWITEDKTMLYANKKNMAEYLRSQLQYHPADVEKRIRHALREVERFEPPLLPSDVDSVPNESELRKMASAKKSASAGEGVGNNPFADVFGQSGKFKTQTPRRR